MDKIRRVTEVRSGAGATGMNENPLQSGADWLSIRTGALTASRMADAMDYRKDGKPGAKRIALMKIILAERMTGDAWNGFVNDAMRWGIDTEAAARAAYELRTGNFVTLMGFVQHPTIDYLGASPDGAVGADGLVEFKCPATTTHIEYMELEEAPEQYRPQMTLQLLSTGRQWCDFVSFDPRIKKESRQMVVRRFEPDQEYRDMIEKVAREFLAEVEARFEAINRETA